MKELNRFLSVVLVLCILFSMVPFSAFASLTMGTKPADGTTTGNPFVQGTGGSNSFRIPAMVTLNDGTIVAAADARWNTTYDGGGLDTIVSYSKDNGATWNYTFANYLGDNGNTYNGSSSTAFIDPALATDGETVYMLCDLYPYGVALNGSSNEAPSTAVGFNDDGTLKLSNNSGSSYNYYLKDGKIYNSGDSVVDGYTVDAYFNIKSTDGSVDTNLFFSDSPYQVVRTGYLYLTKSTDGGKTWSEPTLIPNVKNSSELVCLVGPGRGLVINVGATNETIIFPVYSYNGSSSSQQMGFIYSSDGGATWSRSANFTGDSWSSESAVVELEDGTLRFFYRNGNSKLYYVDYSWTNGWGTAENTGIATNSNTQISAISLQGTVDGKQVILVSCPTGPNEAGSNSSSASNRLNGKIFVGLVNEDGSMSWQDNAKISVPSVNSSNQFMYSCLTALTDSDGNQTGKVAILYEDYESAWGNGYYTMSFATYDLSKYVTFDEIVDENIYVDVSDITINFGAFSYGDVTITAVAPEVLSGKTYVAYDIAVADFSGTSAKVTIPLNGTFTDNAKLYAVYINGSGKIDGERIAGEYDTDADTFTFEAKHFSTYAVLAEEDPVVENKEDKVSSNGGTSESYVLDTDGLDNGAQYLIVYKDSASATSGVAINTSKGSVNVSINGDYATPNEDASAALWTITSYTSYGSTYYYLSNGTNYLYPSRSYDYWSQEYTYSLNITTTRTGVAISRSSNTYSVATINNNNKCYLCYDNGWTAKNSSQSFYFYKYTEGTESWTVDPALQEQRVTNLTVSDDGYTTESWNAYQTALSAANAKLTEVKAATYSSEADAKAALAELMKLVDALETAKNNLKKPVSITISYKANNVTVKTETLQVADDATSLTLSSTVVGTDGKTYEVRNTTLALDLASTTTYSVAVTERVGTPISIKENETTTISVDLADGQYVKWSSADSNYVGVAGKYDTTAGAYTNEAILAGQNVTDSPVTVTGTVYNADGTVAGTYKWLVTVTEGDADTKTDSKGIYFNISTIEHCTVYYSINGGELIPVNGTGVTTGNWTGNGTYTGHFNIMFFAAPDEGYALTYMYIEGTNGDYYTLANGSNPDGTDSDAWPFIDPAQATIPTSDSDATIWKTVNGSLHGFRWALLEGNMTIDRMKVLFSNAIALGCDGVTTQTKNSTSGIGSANDPMELKFVAQKLPTVEKTIKSIIHNGTETAYTDGMKVEIGDTIKYTVVVTRYATNATYGTITYDNEKLMDALTNNNGISNPDMGTSTTSDKTYSYTTSLVLTTANFSDVVKDGKITNTVDFSYSYSSYYSAGSLTTEASAVAEITVSIPSYVIDFGLPVSLDLTNVATAYNGIKSGIANYGTVAVADDGKTVTYTPNMILKGVDYITLTLGNGGTIQVAIYPATTVYYEEGFASYNYNEETKVESPWTGNGSNPSKGSGTQAAQVAGSSSDEYGYDGKYAGESAGPSNGSQATSSTLGDTATFTFTGSGFELYANCTTESGYITVIVMKKYDNTYTPVKAYIVNTVAADGKTSATDGQAINLYSLPVISEQGLEHGTYKVTITHSVDNKTVSIDGFRIYGTLKEEPSFYTDDDEDDPTFTEMRDEVLTAQKVNTSDSQYADQIAGQVFSSANITSEGVIIIDSADTDYDLMDLLDNGPKNEIFLRPGQSLVFKVVTDREVQIGLKAPGKATTYTISGGDTNVTGGTMATSTDMFYKIVSQAAEATSYIITITNTGDGILSITKLKICDDPNATLGTLTEEDLIPALLSLGFELDPSSVTPEEPEEPVVSYADAKYTISLVDKKGKPVGVVELTANGVEGETKTFTAREILAAVMSQMPKGYVLENISAISDVEVVYGQSVASSFRVFNVGSLVNSLIKGIFQKKGPIMKP